MIYQYGSGTSVFKVGFTRIRKNGKRRYFATIYAKDREDAKRLFKELLFDEEVFTEPGKYELCSGDWKVISEEILY